jgi:hypothetical protein
MAAVRKFSVIFAHLPRALNREIFLNSMTGTWSPSGPELSLAGPMGAASLVERLLNCMSNETQFLRSGKY